MSAAGYHSCPGCARQIRTHLFACSVCWALLPGKLKHRILRAYRPGQETNFRLITPGYTKAALEAKALLKGNELPFETDEEGPAQ